MRLASIIVAASFAASALAQDPAPNPRYEIMWRMRELDRAWLSHVTAAERILALPLIAKAEQPGGGPLNLHAKADELDTARFFLLHHPERGRAFDALAVVPAERLIDVGTTRVELTFSHWYGEPYAGSFALDARLDGRAVGHFEQSSGLKDESLAFQLDTAHVAAGDHTLELAWGDDDGAFARREMTLSFVEHRDARIAALEVGIAALPDNAPSIERHALSKLDILLYCLANGIAQETDYPGARMLAEAEQVVAAAAKGERYYGAEHTGQFWLELPTGEKDTTHVRVLVPEEIERDKPSALVIALTRAPSSENMYFDGYGAGRIVKLCEERKWLLVAPKSNGGVNFESTVALIDAVAAIYPVDRSRVFLIGHSQGAGFGLEVARAAPTKFRGVAALSSGFALDVSALTRTPIFIGAGDHDEWGSNGAKIVDDLCAAGSTVAVFKTYPNCERLMIVADALPDVFAWFDSLAK